MNTPLSPVAGIFIIVLGLLFVFLFVAWCCKQCGQSKETIAPLISPQDPLYSRRYMTAIDVQTGLPVIIQTVGRNSRNLVRVSSVNNDGRYGINHGFCSTTYGSIVRNVPPPHLLPPSQSDVIARTPPPPYSEVCSLPRA